MVLGNPKSGIDVRFALILGIFFMLVSCGPEGGSSTVNNYITVPSQTEGYGAAPNQPSGLESGPNPRLNILNYIAEICETDFGYCPIPSGSVVRINDYCYCGDIEGRGSALNW